MKINGQYPRLQSQEKGITNKKDTIEQKNSQENQKSEKTQNPLVANFALKRVRQKIESEPDMNMEKVARLRAEIQSGKYNVDAEKLAGKLLKNALMEDFT